ncbi:MAG TPA: AraC family transcriptional regulator [Chroococcales cyanobacterium]|jgi:AraC-like DNA-binding protein
MGFQERTIADHKERLNKVLAYIQENLDGPLSLETLSRVACFSPFHFHRVFAANIGEPLNAYIRRLRLEKAAFDLCHSEETITQIALSVGYETAAAFTKAFKQYFGKNPSEFKKNLPSFQEMVDSIKQNWEQLNLSPPKFSPPFDIKRALFREEIPATIPIRRE